MGRVEYHIQVRAVIKGAVLHIYKGFSPTIRNWILEPNLAAIFCH
jgi:hypothetical protein